MGDGATVTDSAISLAKRGGSVGSKKGSPRGDARADGVAERPLAQRIDRWTANVARQADIMRLRRSSDAVLFQVATGRER